MRGSVESVLGESAAATEALGAMDVNQPKQEHLLALKGTEAGGGCMRAGGAVQWLLPGVVMVSHAKPAVMSLDQSFSFHTQSADPWL